MVTTIDFVKIEVMDMNLAIAFTLQVEEVQNALIIHKAALLCIFLSSLRSQ